MTEEGQAWLRRAAYWEGFVFALFLVAFIGVPLFNEFKAPPPPPRCEQVQP